MDDKTSPRDTSGLLIETNNRCDKSGTFKRVLWL